MNKENKFRLPRPRWAQGGGARGGEPEGRRLNRSAGSGGALTISFHKFCPLGF